jgi:hypothetical protein
MLGNVHQDPIGDRLPGETGPGSAEGHGNVVLLAELEQGLDLADGSGLHHSLRHEPKIRSVIGIRDPVDQAGVDTGGRKDSCELHDEGSFPLIILAASTNCKENCWKRQRVFRVILDYPEHPQTTAMLVWR